MTTAPQLDLAASLAGRYTIERELGRGGMATVYVAQDLKHDRPVALKVLHPELAATLGPERFRREIAVAAKLQHPHILSVHDSGETPAGQLWFTMPYVEGESLRDRLRRAKQLPLDDALRITREVAGALDYAHAHGVIHRDIKPENILLTTQGNALLADFGIARALAANSSTDGTLTQTGTAVGTPQYMSPEQAAGERDLTPQTDIYSLGAVCYEMMTGEPPFTGATAQAVIAKMMASPAPSARVARPAVPAAVDGVVRRALAPVPADRYATAAQFGTALETAERSAMTAGVDAPASGRRGRRVPTGVALLGLGFLVGVGVLFAWRAHTGGSSGSAAAGPIRLAVLPFENLGDSADAYFADGITDEVRGELAAVPGLEVVAGRSSNKYRRTTADLPDIARELGVEYLLVGKIRWAKGQGGASRVRVSPELIRVLPGAAPRTKWEAPFDAALTDVFQVQADIAGRVARALNVALGPTGPQTLAARPTTSPEAYDLYLRANEYLNHSNRADGMIAIQLYERAVTLDSSFAVAWAKLAIAHADAYWEDWDPSPNRLDSARHAGERALALQPELPEGHLALGYYHYWGHRDYERALAEFALTARSQPNNADVFEAVGYIRRRQGKWLDAIAALKRSVELDPLAYVKRFELGVTYALVRDNSEAERQLDRAIALAPDLPNAYADKIVLYMNWAGHLDQAPAVMREALSHMDFGKLIAETPNAGSVLSIELLAADPTYSAEVAGVRPAAFGKRLVGYFGFKAAVYRVRRQTEQARIYYDSLAAAARNELRERPDEARIHGVLGVAEAYLAHHDRATQEGRRAVELLPVSKDAYFGPFVERQLAEIYTVVGAPDMAIDQLQAVLAVPSQISAAGLAADPTFAVLHGNPRFERLIAQPATGAAPTP